MVELSASNIEIFSTREEKPLKEKVIKPLVEKTVDSKPVKQSADEKPANNEKKITPAYGKDGKPLKNAETKTNQRSQSAK